MKLRISRQAWNDLLDVKAYTLEQYGWGQLEEYESLIEEALERIVGDPASGKERTELQPGVRSRHIGQPGRRARHSFFYRVSSDGAVEVIRFLHDAMDFVRHLPEGGEGDG
jgi:toxin ParE1/3/4